MKKIVNTRKSLLHLPPVPRDGYYKGHGGQELAPGVNEVDAQYLDAVSDHHVVAEWLALGWIKPYEAPAEVPAEELPAPTGALPAVQS